MIQGSKGHVKYKKHGGQFMVRRSIVIILSFFFTACIVFAAVAAVFFITPSRKAQSSISLPAQVEDPEGAADDNGEENENSTYDNTYIADVHQSLTLRTQPDSNATPIIEEGLAAMTKMQVIRYVDNTNFAYVEVINGPYKGYEGYVNYEYITKLGEPTLRIGSD